jgi:hypothetical protein
LCGCGVFGVAFVVWFLGFFGFGLFFVCRVGVDLVLLAKCGTSVCGEAFFAKYRFAGAKYLK